MEEQLKGEVTKLMAMAEAANGEQTIPDGMSLPEEIARREDRIKAIAAAKTRIEQRAKERHQQEQAEYEAKVSKQKEKAEQSGNPPQ